MKTLAKAAASQSQEGYRHLLLVIALILVAFVRPFFGGTSHLVGLLDAGLFGTLLVGAYAMRPRPLTWRLILASAILSLGFLAALLSTEHEGLLYGFIGSYGFFLGLVALSVVRSLFAPGRRVDADMLHGALAAYLVIGILWSLIYVGVEMARPGTFVFAAGQPSGGAFFMRFVGFSFTTLTTLGYGNVAPTTAQGDAIAGLEAVVGQLYLAIIIARVVAMQIAQDVEHVSGRR